MNKSGWALIERKLRKRKTEQMSSRYARLEKKYDPNRTSSGIMPTGDTRPEDVL